LEPFFRPSLQRSIPAVLSRRFCYLLMMALALSISLSAKTLDVSSQQNQDDPYEENDSVDSAAAIVPGLYEGLICGDEDWYWVELDQVSTLSVAIVFRHADNNLDLQLYRQDGSTLLSESRSHRDIESIRMEDLEAGSYRIRAYSESTHAIAYDLAIVLNRAMVVKVESTENDWYLPANVERDWDSGFYKLGMKDPSPEIPILSNGGWPNWDDLNPAENVYRFDLIENKDQS
jgi:hypothetical protein